MQESTEVGHESNLQGDIPISIIFFSGEELIFYINQIIIKQVVAWLLVSNLRICSATLRRKFLAIKHNDTIIINLRRKN